MTLVRRFKEGEKEKRRKRAVARSQNRKDRIKRGATGKRKRERKRERERERERGRERTRFERSMDLMMLAAITHQYDMAKKRKDRRIYLMYKSRCVNLQRFEERKRHEERSAPPRWR